MSAAMRAVSQKRWDAARDALSDEDDSDANVDEQGEALRSLALAARDMRARPPSGGEKVIRSGMEPSRSGNRLVKIKDGEERPPPATGFRLIDLELMSETLGPHLACGLCSHVGAMILSGRDEAPAGFSSLLKWWCSRCRAIGLELPTSPSLPRRPGQMGPALKQANVQALTAAVQIGIGTTQLRTFASVLGMPKPHPETMMSSESVVYPAMEEAGRVSSTSVLSCMVLFAQWRFLSGALVVASSKKKSFGRSRYTGYETTDSCPVVSVERTPAKLELLSSGLCRSHIPLDQRARAGPAPPS